MKLNVGKRILMFLHWLCSLLVGAALVLLVLKPPFAVDLYKKGRALVNDSQLKIICIAALAIYAILMIAQLCLIFKRRRRADRDFIIMDNSETGRIRIAVSAIESMVRQSVTDIEGISDMKIRIDSNEDSIDIGVNASIVNGGHVPTTTMNMQRSIRQFVEMNCGVAVRSVSVNIRSVTEPNAGKRGKKKNVAPVVLPEPAPVEPAPEPIAVDPVPEEPAAVEPETYEPEPAEPVPAEPEAEAFEPEAETYAPEPAEPEAGVFEAEPAYEEPEDLPEAEPDAFAGEAEDAAPEDAEAFAFAEPEADEEQPADPDFEAAVDAASDVYTAEDAEPALEDDDGEFDEKPFAEPGPGEDEAPFRDSLDE